MKKKKTGGRFFVWLRNEIIMKILIRKSMKMLRGTQMESSTTMGKAGSHSQRCVIALQMVCGRPGLHWSASSQKSPTRKPRLLMDMAGTVSGWPWSVQDDDHLDDATRALSWGWSADKSTGVSDGRKEKNQSRGVGPANKRTMTFAAGREKENRHQVDGFYRIKVDNNNSRSEKKNPIDVDGCLAWIFCTKLVLLHQLQTL